MKLTFASTATIITSSATILTLLSSFAFQHASASPQGIFFNKPSNNPLGSNDPAPDREPSSEPEPEPDPEPALVKLSIYPSPVGRPKQTLIFGMNHGLALQSLNMVTDVVVATMDEAPENIHCLFWRLNDQNRSFLDRSHVMALGVVVASIVENAFSVMCYDSTRPEILNGYASS